MKLPPKEQIPKMTLGANLSGIQNCSVTHLWRERKNDYATKGEDFTWTMKLKLSGERTEKGRTLPFFVLFCMGKLGETCKFKSIYQRRNDSEYEWE